MPEEVKPEAPKTERSKDETKESEAQKEPETRKKRKNLKQAMDDVLAAMERLESLGYTRQASPRRVAERVARFTGVYPAPNIAVELCEKIYIETIEKALEDNKTPDAARQAGSIAYATVMPRLSGAENIRDFIACVAQGMLLGAISSSDATRLLYASKVAYGACRAAKKKRKNTGKTVPKQETASPATPTETAA